MTTLHEKDENLHTREKANRLTWAAAHRETKDLVSGVAWMLRCYTRK